MQRKIVSLALFFSIIVSLIPLQNVVADNPYWLAYDMNNLVSGRIVNAGQYPYFDIEEIYRCNYYTYGGFGSIWFNQTISGWMYYAKMKATSGNSPIMYANAGNNFSIRVKFRINETQHETGDIGRTLFWYGSAVNILGLISSVETKAWIYLMGYSDWYHLHFYLKMGSTGYDFTYSTTLVYDNWYDLELNIVNGTVYMLNYNQSIPTCTGLGTIPDSATFVFSTGVNMLMSFGARPSAVANLDYSNVFSGEIAYLYWGMYANNPEYSNSIIAWYHLNENSGSLASVDYSGRGQTIEYMTSQFLGDTGLYGNCIKDKVRLYNTDNLYYFDAGYSPYVAGVFGDMQLEDSIVADLLDTSKTVSFGYWVYIPTSISPHQELTMVLFTPFVSFGIYKDNYATSCYMKTASTAWQIHPFSYVSSYNGWHYLYFNRNGTTGDFAFLVYHQNGTLVHSLTGTLASYTDQEENGYYGLGGFSAHYAYAYAGYTLNIDEIKMMWGYYPHTSLWNSSLYIPSENGSIVEGLFIEEGTDTETIDVSLVPDNIEAQYNYLYPYWQEIRFASSMAGNNYTIYLKDKWIVNYLTFSEFEVNKSWVWVGQFSGSLNFGFQVDILQQIPIGNRTYTFEIYEGDIHSGNFSNYPPLVRLTCHISIYGAFTPTIEPIVNFTHTWEIVNSSIIFYPLSPFSVYNKILMNSHSSVLSSIKWHISQLTYYPSSYQSPDEQVLWQLLGEGYLIGLTGNLYDFNQSNCKIGSVHSITFNALAKLREIGHPVTFILEWAIKAVGTNTPTYTELVRSTITLIYNMSIPVEEENLIITITPNEFTGKVGEQYPFTVFVSSTYGGNYWWDTIQDKPRTDIRYIKITGLPDLLSAGQSYSGMLVLPAIAINQTLVFKVIAYDDPSLENTCDVEVNALDNGVVGFQFIISYSNLQLLPAQTAWISAMIQSTDSISRHYYMKINNFFTSDVVTNLPTINDLGTTTQAYKDIEIKATSKAVNGTYSIEFVGYADVDNSGVVDSDEYMSKTLTIVIYGSPYTRDDIHPPPPIPPIDNGSTIIPIEPTSLIPVFPPTGALRSLLDMLASMTGVSYEIWGMGFGILILLLVFISLAMVRVASNIPYIILGVAGMILNVMLGFWSLWILIITVVGLGAVLSLKISGAVFGGGNEGSGDEE